MVDKQTQEMQPMKPWDDDSTEKELGGNVVPKFPGEEGAAEHITKVLAESIPYIDVGNVIDQLLKKEMAPEDIESIVSSTLHINELLRADRQKVQLDKAAQERKRKENRRDVYIQLISAMRQRLVDLKIPVLDKQPEMVHLGVLINTAMDDTGYSKGMFLENTKPQIRK